MKLTSISTLLLLLFGLKGLSQNGEVTVLENKAVKLIEEKLEKRWLLYAQNTTEEEKEVFLMVQGDGFRRSADRPVIKQVPPGEKILMLTLIPLKEAQPTYSTIFTFDNKLQKIEKNHSDYAQEYINIRPIKVNEITVYVGDECPKCDILVNHLNMKHITFRKMDVNRHHAVHEFMFNQLKDSISEAQLISLPVIQYKNQRHFNIDNINQFVKHFSFN